MSVARLWIVSRVGLMPMCEIFEHVKGIETSAPDRVAKATKMLEAGAKKHFEFEGSALRVSYNENPPLNFDQCMIDADVGLLGQAETRTLLVDAFSQTDALIQSHLVDKGFEERQNLSDLIEFEAIGLSTEGLPRKTNGLPPPLAQEVIDTDRNPGRFRLHTGYVEQVAGSMWFGQAFWEHTSRHLETVGKELAAFGDFQALGNMHELALRSGLINDATTAAKYDAVRAVLFPQIDMTT